MDLVLRPLSRADIPAWAALLAAVEVVEHTGEPFSETDLAEEMDNPEVTVGTDFVGAYDGDRSSSATSRCCRAGRPRAPTRCTSEGAALPARRGEGIGTALVEAMIARGTAAAAERSPALPARLSTTGLSTNAEQEDLLTGHGMSGERWNFVMRTALADLAGTAAGRRRLRDPALRRVDGPGGPGGAQPRLRRLAPELHALDRDHLEAVGHRQPHVPPGGQRRGGPGRPDQLVGYVATHEFDAYFDATGRREAYVGKVGVLPEHRGRGLAGAMLGHCLATYAAAGYDEASLDADSENPSGALGVYRRCGFEVESRWTNDFLTVPV